MKSFKMNDEDSSRVVLRFKSKSIPELKEDLADPSKRVNAETLLYTRYNIGESCAQRREAGKALGYSDLRLRIHEWRLGQNQPSNQE